MFYNRRIKDLEKRVETLEYEKENLRHLYNRLSDIIDYLNVDIKKVAKANKEMKNMLTSSNSSIMNK